MFHFLVTITYVVKLGIDYILNLNVKFSDTYS